VEERRQPRAQRMDRALGHEDVDLVAPGDRRLDDRDHPPERRRSDPTLAEPRQGPEPGEVATGQRRPAPPEATGGPPSDGDAEHHPGRREELPHAREQALEAIDLLLERRVHRRTGAKRAVSVSQRAHGYRRAMSGGAINAPRISPGNCVDPRLLVAGLA